MICILGYTNQLFEWEVCKLSRSIIFGTLRTVACQAPLSYGIFWRILEWVAVSSSRGYSQLRDGIWVSCVSCIAGGFFTH